MCSSALNEHKGYSVVALPDVSGAFSSGWPKVNGFVSLSIPKIWVMVAINVSSSMVSIDPLETEQYLIVFNSEHRS
jgi:hypothetical protein